MASGLRVGVVAAQLCAPVPGGTGRYTRELLRALAGSQGPGRSVYAAAPIGCRPAAQLGVAVRTLPAPARALSRLWEWGLPPVVSRSGVVHAPTLLVPPARAGAALVVTCHDVVPWTHPQTLTPRGVRFHQRMGRRAAQDADLILTPTEAVAGQVRTWLQPRCPVRAQLLGATSLVVPPDAGRRRDALGVADPYVLFVGTAEPRKGLDVLVAALADPALRGIHLAVVGPPGWGEVSVQELAQRAGTAERTRVLGPVPDSDLAALYTGAGALAMPSRAEGFGLPVLEAMGAGVPVVISDDPALVEVGAGAAWVAPVGDVDALARTLAAALTPSDVRQERVVLGRARAATLTWPQVAEATWAAYREVVG